jgi:Na+/proline symporter
MIHYTLFDAAIILGYVAAVLLIGFLVKRKTAAGGVESYFLGNRKLPWWMLAMSGSSSYFDITGTMWIVSILVVTGLRGMWIQFVWGFIIAAFYMAYMGKWIRRSGVVTGAEWMVSRFGSGRAGDLARLSYTLYAILTISAFLGYTTVGMGKFGAELLPLPAEHWLRNEHLCAAMIVGITGLYVVVGGFRGLILVEFFQTIILTLGAIMLAYLGFAAFRGATLASPPPADWFSIWPVWTLQRDVPVDSVYSLASQPMYTMFGAVVIVYVAKGLLLCASGPEQLYDFQKFLAVRNPREASLMGMLWGVFHTVRFPMAAGIAMLGIAGFAADPELLRKISTDPEKVLPLVIAHALPAGLRGLALAALISAFMGTFAAMVNGGASYLVRDIYQRYLRPAAGNRELVYASYVSSILFILVGITISLFAKSINQMFTWIMAGLGAGVLMPNVLRWYWARFNGWGYFAGMMAAMVLSLIQVVLESAGILNAPVYVTFPALALGVMAISVIVTLLTPPTDDATLMRFYRNVQPAGAWGRVASLVQRDTPGFRKESFATDLVNVCVAVVWLSALYVAPVLWVANQLQAASIAGGVVLVTSIVLLFTWWPNLPRNDAAEQDSQTLHPRTTP